MDERANEIEGLEAVLDAYSGKLERLTERLGRRCSLIEHEYIFLHRHLIGDIRWATGNKKGWRTFHRNVEIWRLFTAEDVPKAGYETRVKEVGEKFKLGRTTVTEALRDIKENRQFDDPWARGAAYRYRELLSGEEPT